MGRRPHQGDRSRVRGNLDQKWVVASLNWWVEAAQKWVELALKQQGHRVDLIWEEEGVLKWVEAALNW